MKFNRKIFAQALNIATMATQKRGTIPILSHAAIIPQGDGAFIRGTDLNMEITVAILGTSPGSQPTKGFTTAHPQRLARVLNLGGEEVEIRLATIDSEQKRFAATSGKLEVQLATLPIDDFPTVSMPTDPAEAFDIPLAHLDLMLRVISAASTEQTRYYLNGLYLHTEEVETTVDTHRVRVVATDGHRLHTASMPTHRASALDKILPKNVGEQRGIVIPTQVFDTLRSLRKRISTSISLSVHGGGSRVMLSFGVKDVGRVTIITNAIDGTYPDYKRIIPPADLKNSINVNRLELLKNLRLIGGASTQRSKAMKLTFDPGREDPAASRLSIALDERLDGIRVEAWMPADTPNDKPFSVGFNGAYLAALCQASRGDNVTLSTDDSGSPARLSSTAADGFSGILMPMRVV